MEEAIQEFTNYLTPGDVAGRSTNGKQLLLRAVTRVANRIGEDILTTRLKNIKGALALDVHAKVYERRSDELLLQVDALKAELAAVKQSTAVTNAEAKGLKRVVFIRDDEDKDGPATKPKQIKDEASEAKGLKRVVFIREDEDKDGPTKPKQIKDEDSDVEETEEDGEFRESMEANVDDFFPDSEIVPATVVQSRELRSSKH